MALEGRKYCNIIGISGVTNAGKTTLSRALSKLLNTNIVLHQDSYFFPEGTPSHVKVKGLDHTNYDILSALDMDKMYKDVLDFMDKKNTEGRKNIMIIEGFTVLNYKPIEELCDLKYFLVLDKDDCLRRRVKRTYDPPDVPGYFDMCVWPEYLKYKKEIDNNTWIKQLDGTKSLADHLNVIECDLKNFNRRNLGDQK